MGKQTFMQGQKTKKTKNTGKWKSILLDLTMFILPAMLATCNLLWLFFMNTGNEKLEQVFLYAMLGLLGVVAAAAIAFFIYLAKDGDKSFQYLIDKEATQQICKETTEPTMIESFFDNKDRDYVALRQYGKMTAIFYITSLIIYLFMLVILPEARAERFAPWAFILGAIEILLCIPIYGRRYFHAEDNYWLHIETDYTKFKTWEKYWAHMLVSDRLGTCFAVVMAIHVLQLDLPAYLTEVQCWYLEQTYSAGILLFIGVIIWEVLSLRRRHKEVMESVPKANETVQNFYSISGALSIFAAPTIHIIIDKYLPEDTARLINLIVSLVIAVALFAGVIYFRVYASRYVKASKLTW